MACYNTDLINELGSKKTFNKVYAYFRGQFPKNEEAISGGKKADTLAVDKYSDGSKKDLKFRDVNVTKKDEKIFYLCLKKMGYCLKKKQPLYLKSVIKAFQRRYRSKTINGKIDRECFEIAKNLVKRGKLSVLFLIIKIDLAFLAKKPNIGQLLTSDLATNLNGIFDPKMGTSK